jgi:hypothetical protein
MKLVDDYKGCPNSPPIATDLEAGPGEDALTKRRSKSTIKCLGVCARSGVYIAVTSG